MTDLPDFMVRRKKAERLHDQFLSDFRGYGLVNHSPREAGVLAIIALIRNVEREYLLELKTSLEDCVK